MCQQRWSSITDIFQRKAKYHLCIEYNCLQFGSIFFWANFNACSQETSLKSKRQFSARLWKWDRGNPNASGLSLWHVWARLCNESEWAGRECIQVDRFDRVIVNHRNPKVDLNKHEYDGQNLWIYKYRFCKALILILHVNTWACSGYRCFCIVVCVGCDSWKVSDL